VPWLLTLMRRSQRSATPLAAVLVALSLAGCSDSGGPDSIPQPITPRALQIVSGNDQRTATGRTLASALRVRVIGSDDQPLAGAAVQWSVSQGQATLDPTESTTDEHGETETRVTLGAAAGSILVNSTTGNLAPVSFSIIALEPLAFRYVSAGFFHTCGVTATDDGYCWGSNSYGKLGDGSEDAQASPRRVSGGLSWAEIHAGGHHTCGITTAGAAYCWGYDRALTRATPVPVAGAVAFKAMSTGNYHTCGVSVAGAAYCWGPNGSGELGDGTTTERLSPVLVAGGLSFLTVGAGNDFSCGITPAGAAYCWGANYTGQLGDGTLTNHSTPMPVAGGLTFTRLGVSGLAACGTTAAGAAYCWGLNELGELGAGTLISDGICQDRLYPCSAIPLPVAGGLSFTTLSGGIANGHSCGLTATGAAYCWGWNVLGQLGDGTTSGNDQCYPQGPENSPSPCSTVPVAVAGNLSFAVVSAGAFHTCGVTKTGAAYCWGGNEAGQLGDGTGVQRLTPVPVSIE
jgi:alpha-tubulin suppressor-like RCC1 family protein